MQVCTSLQTDNHASTPPLCFLQAGCPSCRPTNSVKALKAPCLVKHELYHSYHQIIITINIVSCYELKMYHLYQYKSDTPSATCQYKNINMLEDCYTMGYA